MKKEKMFKISQKLIALLVIMIILPTGILGVISFITASNVTEKEIRSSASSAMNYIEENINTFTKMHEENLQIVSKNANIKNILNKKPEEVVYVYDILQSYKEGHKDVLNVFVGRIDKKIDLFPIQKLPDGYDPTTRDWYKLAKEQNKMLWTEPYIDMGTGKLVVSLVVPIYDYDNKFVGVLGVDISLESLTTIVSKSKIADNGYVFLMDSKGVMITNPSKDLIGKELAIADLKQAVYATSKGTKDYTDNKSRMCAYFSTAASTCWRIVGVFEYKEIAEKVKSIWVISLFSGMLIVIVAVFLGILTSRPITKSIQVLSVDMQKIGNGDFTIKTPILSNDEIGLLAKAMNKMSEELRSLMSKVKLTVSEVSASADSLAASSEETTSSTEEISRTIAEISNASSDEAHNLETGLIKTTELAENIQGVSESINIIKDMVDNSNQLNQKGLHTVEGLRIKSKQRDEASDKVADAIVEVDKYSEQIGEIINAIRSIADQTNLLALNASIEAARAGEAGKGFAVVADEIRKLAEQSANSAKSIGNLILAIQSQSKNAVISLEDSKPIVDAQIKAVNETQLIFDEISTTIKQLTNEVNGITALNNKMIERKNQILAIMDNISATSEETSASTEEVSSSAQEQLAAMLDVAKTAEQLNIFAQSLNEEIGKFKV